jgi:hypothetical protein
MMRDADAAALTQFYRVGLICEAASEIGCGIRAKPVLKKLEAHESVGNAWLNATGTILAVRWKRQSLEDERILAFAFTGEPPGCAEKLSDPDVRRGLLDALARGEGWYRAADVDQLSEREAAIIAARMVKRLSGKLALEPEVTDRLTRSLAQACRRMLTTETPGTYESRAQRLQAAMLAAARAHLTDDQYAVFQRSAAVDGHRPLPHER